MRFDYTPGLYGPSDFSGKNLAMDTGTGAVDVEIFVAVLAHSNLVYAEAMPNQKGCHWTMAHRRALEYYSDSVQRRIIDNLKSGVVKADREVPHLNPSLREFALHYGLAVLPARKKNRRTKGRSRGAGKTVQTRILLALRHETFFSLEAKNAAIRRELNRLNDSPMSCGASRRALFEESERAALIPLRAFRTRCNHCRVDGSVAVFTALLKSGRGSLTLAPGWLSASHPASKRRNEPRLQFRERHAR